MGLGEDLSGDRADPLLEPGDHSRLELGRNRFAVGRVPGWIHRQQHVAHVLERYRVEIFDHHPAFGCGEDLAVLGDANNVFVAKHRPVARLVVHLDPGDRLTPSLFVEPLVGRSVDIGVGIGDPPGHWISPPSGGRPRRRGFRSDQ